MESEDNKTELFVLIQKVIGEIKGDFSVVNNGNIRFNIAGDRLLILDKVAGRIADKLASDWKIKEVK